MMQIIHHLIQIMRDPRGVTALEYGLIAAVIGGVVITAATKFGNSLTSAYSTIGSTLVAKAGGM